MFFDNIELLERKRTILKQLPPTPDTGWLPPRDYPSLEGVIAVGLDYEVKETDFDHGPGWSRGKSSIVGGSLELLYRDGSTYCEYRPIHHEVEPEFNLDPETTMAFWRDVHRINCPKLGANLPYDIGNATDSAIDIRGELFDIQYAEALLDDSAEVALEVLGEKYLGKGKESNLLYQWCADAFGGEPTGKQRENLYRCSPRLVGPYAMSDASMPRAILAKQWPLLQAAGMVDLFNMECRLIRLMIAMRMQGVRVDIDKAEQMRLRIIPLIKILYARLHDQSGIHCESTTGNDIKKVFQALNIPTPYTKPSKTYPQGQPSINKEWLNALDHPIADTILEIRKLETLLHTFLESYILGSNVNGIVHGEFHQLRNDEGGTKVGRLSSSNPNLQNIPIRTELGKEVRSAFIPFQGHACWLKGDFSQLQYRLLAHYAVGPSGQQLRDTYNSNPDVDYHDNMQQLVKRVSGLLIKRKPIKNMNFGKMFGAGKKKIKRMMQLESDGEVTQAIADQVYEECERAAPYLKATMDEMSLEAQTNGYVISLLGRRLRFELWEPAQVDYENRAIALPYDRALREYGSHIKRAGTHRAISGKLQGGEGDIIKTGLDKCNSDGVFDVTGVPTTLVHDEGNWSVKERTPIQAEAFNHIREVMETALPVRVPIKFGMGCGPTWGDID